MKILFCLPDFPYPAHGGAPIRNLGLIQGVAQAGHEVHLLTFGKPGQNTPLHATCKSITFIEPPQRSKMNRLKTLLLTHQADMETRRWSEAFAEALRQKLEEIQFDIIQFENLEMTPYVDLTRQQQPNAKLIYDAHNAEADIQRLAFLTDLRILTRLPLGLYSWFQWKRLEVYEQSVFEKVDAIVAVSDTDQKIIQQTAPNKAVYLVPNGINVEEYSIPPDQPIELKHPAILFTGIMDYRPNVDAMRWFAGKVMHLIPDAHLYIVGNRPSKSVQKLDKNERITVTGFVPDILPYLHTADIVIAPLRIGSGTRLKLLQAMAAGKAIVSTTVGAMGLDVTDEKELFLADDPLTFAASVYNLMTDAEKRQKLGKRAQKFVRDNFDWTVVVPRLLEAYDEVVAK